MGMGIRNSAPLKGAEFFCLFRSCAFLLHELRFYFEATRSCYMSFVFFSKLRPYCYTWNSYIFRLPHNPLHRTRPLFEFHHTNTATQKTPHHLFFQCFSKGNQIVIDFPRTCNGKFIVKNVMRKGLYLVDFG